MNLQGASSVGEVGAAGKEGYLVSVGSRTCVLRSDGGLGRLASVDGVDRLA